MSLSPKEQLDVLQNTQGIPNFEQMLKRSDFHPLRSQSIDIFQINIGKLCNLTCQHCHVNAGPSRVEVMSKEILQKCLDIVRTQDISTIDITGGAPEMNPHLEWFIAELASLNKRVIVRTNLVILLEEPYQKFIDIYSRNKVEIVCSLPNLHADRTDRMRGKDSYFKSIEVLRLLNDKGYGKEGSQLLLDIVHNAVGAYLSAEQSVLEYEYKKHLWDNEKVKFSRLFSLSNMPIGRYLDYLLRSGNYEDYMQLLVSAYNPKAVENVMCRSTISIGWDGKLYDCDFNQMLDLTVNHGCPNNIDDFNSEKLKSRDITIFNHCYGCTAGSGSSCQGATT